VGGGGTKRNKKPPVVYQQQQQQQQQHTYAETGRRRISGKEFRHTARAAIRSAASDGNIVIYTRRP